MSDGRFSSKPLRSERSRDGAGRDGEFSAEGTLSTDATRAFLQSLAVQREVNALTEEPFPEVGPRVCAPLHKRTPAAALDMGRPLASATLVQEYLIGLLFLRVVGWIFMLFGVVFIVGAVAALVDSMTRGIDERGTASAGFILAFMGLAIGGVGAWFGYFRGRVITEMCWFCPRGMIWMTEGAFEWYAWEDVRDVYCTPNADRPAIGIGLGRNVSWISFSNTEASRLMVEYIEKQASAACVPTVLQRVAEGRTVRFGVWRLSRYSVHNAEMEIAWRDVIEVDCGEREVFIKGRDNAKLFVRLDEIPFPSLFTVLARASLGHARERMV